MTSVWLKEEVPQRDPNPVLTLSVPAPSLTSLRSSGTVLELPERRPQSVGRPMVETVGSWLCLVTHPCDVPSSATNLLPSYLKVLSCLSTFSSFFFFLPPLYFFLHFFFFLLLLFHFLFFFVLFPFSFPSTKENLGGDTVPPLPRTPTQPRVLVVGDGSRPYPSFLLLLLPVWGMDRTYSSLEWTWRGLGVGGPLGNKWWRRPRGPSVPVG